MSFRPIPPLLPVLVVAGCLLAAAPTGAAGSHAETLARARAFVEAGDAAAAGRLLKPLTDGRNPDPAALVVRSEVRVLEGDLAGAFDDLERALERDPTLRQGWMNLAGLEIAQANFPRALEALEKARALAPDSEDNDLNLGAVHALMGHRDQAKRHFDRYLDRHRESADAHYLVAANFALAGFADLAVAALEWAIRLDESKRLAARSDDRFLALDSSPAYRELLERDLYTPPADHRTAAAAFAVPWSRQDPQLLYALLDAMREAGLGWNPTIETATTWAIVRGGLRARIATQANGTGVITLSAPPDGFAADEWQRLTQEIFRSIWNRLKAGAKPPP